MIPNHSPWIKQLNRTRPAVSLNQNLTTNVAIVGGGIAGIASAYFTLKYTQKSVVLIEATKIAHGATGHNAGQLTSYFERPLSDIVKEFGLKLAIEGQRGVESAWLLIEEIMNDANLQTPLYRFTGYAGLSHFEQLMGHLENNRCRVDGGITAETIVIAEEWNRLADIPEQFHDLFTTAPKKDILALLETDSDDYIALLAYPKGCMNSALFTEELLGYMVTKFPDRFSFYEESPVSTVHLFQKCAKLTIKHNTVTASRVVLCTNGFENFSISNEVGIELDTKFHHLVAGRIGYMVGYTAPLDHSPTAISYFPKNGFDPSDPTGESYYYLTRRPHEHEGSDTYNLICTGGPDKVLPNDAVYSREDSCSEDVKNEIDGFLFSNFNKHPRTNIEYEFCWHGLMGYTPNGIRRIGPEPCNEVLLYNLGCNGIGILPSIFGGKLISRYLADETVEETIFDPQDQRCVINPKDIRKNLKK